MSIDESLIALSRQKWDWISATDVDFLEARFQGGITRNFRHRGIT
ncbi:hypothetical protein [Nesterenkonia halobia]